MIDHKLQIIRGEIASLAKQAGRSAEQIRLIAVSKTRPLEDVQQAILAGQCDFGENTVQDASTKIPFVDPAVQWHFIGHLQSKKSGQIPGAFNWIHSIDSMKLANKLANAMRNHPQADTLNCLIQVNVAAEPSKSGLATDQLKPFIEQLLSQELTGLAWRGLMTMGVHNDVSQTQRVFARCRELQHQIASEYQLPGFDQLSMGMSGDYADAIREGATMVRIGTAIFGSR